MKPERLLIPLTLSLLQMACSSSPNKDFENIKDGMAKYDVLDTMGCPKRTERIHGQDRWTYIFFDEDKEHTKQVLFNQGKVVYKGDPQLPLVSAEEEDRKNEIANLDIEKKYAQRRAEIKAHPIEEQADAAALDIKTNAPQFTPIE